MSMTAACFFAIRSEDPNLFLKVTFLKLRISPILLQALESRLLTRHEARKFAREAYDLGVRYIGGCCGFEPYHIREMSDEVGTNVLYDFVENLRHCIKWSIDSQSRHIEHLSR